MVLRERQVWLSRLISNLRSKCYRWGSALESQFPNYFGCVRNEARAKIRSEGRRDKGKVKFSSSLLPSPLTFLFSSRPIFRASKVLKSPPNRNAWGAGLFISFASKFLHFRQILPHFFIFIHIGQVAKVYRDCWEERLKVIKLAKFESRVLVVFFTDVYMLGEGDEGVGASAYKRLQNFPTLKALTSRFQRIRLTSLAMLLIFGRSFKYINFHF